MKRKNSFIITFFLLLIICCKEKQPEKPVNIPTKQQPLSFTINFKDFGDHQINISDIDWKNHSKDSIVYFKINFENLKKEPITIKTSLVSPNIPFIVQYNKLNKVDEYTDGNKMEYFNLNIVQQFNTIYNDSIIFKTSKNIEIPFVDQAFRIGYHHIGVDEICQIQPKSGERTIDLYDADLKGCIEKKR